MAMTVLGGIRVLERAHVLTSPGLRNHPLLPAVFVCQLARATASVLTKFLSVFVE